ncbi:MAG TPA: radical SAM protein [Candidatus Acidoferrales bacterium]|nr:radical SAM protein [Candidatus Acidoferrales bacterium]
MNQTPVMDSVIRRSMVGSVPLSVHFDVTYRCNERCVHCYLDHEDYGELETTEIKNILIQLAASGTLMLTFSGGEIFLREDFFELLEFAKDLHFDIALKSNALMITAARAARLRALGVRQVQVSVYSADPEIHDAITKVRGSFARSLKAIRFLKSQGLRVKIACPLMKQNLAGLRQLRALADELGISYVIDMTITPKLDGDTSVLALRNSAEDLLGVMQDPTLQGKAVLDDGSESGVGSAISSGMEGDAYDGIPCSAGHNTCYISPYGDVYPCVQMPVAAGNLRTEKFDEIWRRSPQFERVRAIRDSDLPVCAKCSIRKYCERCPGLAQMEGGDLLGAYERACELAEMKARVAGVANPVSAWHAQNDGKILSPATLSSLVQIASL